MIAGIAGFLVVLSLPTVRDAWQVNEAGIALNRAIVLSADAARKNDPNAPTIMAAGGDYVLTPPAETLVERALSLMESAGSRGPHTASREVPIWRTYGAAARLLPSDHAFQLLSRSRDAARLDWLGELWLGEVASATGRWDEAADSYRRVDVSNLLVYRAEAHIADGQKDLALRELDLAQASLDAVVDREKAELLLLDRAGTRPSPLAGMMQRPAERATTLSRIGHGLLSLGRPAGAQPVLEQALATAATSSPGPAVEKSIRFDLAAALALTLPETPPGKGFGSEYSYYPDETVLNRLQGMIRVRALVHQALALDSSAYSRVRAGTILIKIGDESHGLTLLTEANKLNPLLPDAYLAIGDWYDRHQMSWAARSLYEQATTLLPDDPAIASALAISTFQTVSPEQALPLLERAVALKTTNANVYVFLGDCYKQAGRSYEAGVTWVRGLQRFPDSEPLAARVHALSTSGGGR